MSPTVAAKLAGGALALVGIGSHLGLLRDRCLWPLEESRVSSGPVEGPKHRRLRGEQEALADGPRDRHPMGTYLKKSFSGAAVSRTGLCASSQKGAPQGLDVCWGSVRPWGPCVPGTPSHTG